MDQFKSMLKKVVVIGGGNGSATSIRALKEFKDEVEISAVISMSDSGGSSGILRQEYNTLPTGDILRAILALSPYPYHNGLKKTFHSNRFSDLGKLSGHNLGNMFLVLAEQYTGSFISALRALEQALEAIGRAYPVTLDKTNLAVELTNGDVIKGEDKIDRPTYDRSLKIKKAWLEPDGRIYKEAKKAIEEADYIILGPGSLYSSVIATLLPKGVKEAISNSSAKLIAVVGGGREGDGETGPETASEIVLQLDSYLFRPVDIIVRNNHALTPEEKRLYKEKNWISVPFDAENLVGRNVVQGDFEREGKGLSAEKLSLILKKLICE
jgi:uncharacterized cofD-like protein